MSMSMLLGKSEARRALRRRRGWAVRMAQRIDDGHSDNRPKNAGGDSSACAAKTCRRKAFGGGAVNAACRAFGGVMEVRRAFGRMMEVRLLGEGRRDKDRRNTAGDCHADEDCYSKFNHCAPSVLLGFIPNRAMTALIGSEKGCTARSHSASRLEQLP